MAYAIFPQCLYLYEVEPILFITFLSEFHESNSIIAVLQEKRVNECHFRHVCIVSGLGIEMSLKG